MKWSRKREKLLENARKCETVKLDLVRAFEDHVRKWIAEDGLHVTCWNGCKHRGCCYQVVGTSLYEGVILAETLEPSRRARLEKQGRAMAEVIRARGGSFTSVAGLRCYDKATGDWFERAEPCALLDERGRCAAYSVRPMSCAVYFVKCDSSECDPPPSFPKTIPVLDHGNVIQQNILLDTEFHRSLRGPEAQIAAPMPLGIAVAMGRRLLEAGPKAAIADFAEFLR